jgi:outer membrane lipoprotein-sorting protein
MRNLSIILSFCFITIIAAGSVPVKSQDLTADQIMDKSDNRPVPVDMKSETVMKLIDKRGKERNRSLKTYRYGDDKQIMWFLSPADVKGSSFLRISYDDRDDDMWLYLPAFGKVRRIASHAKKGSFMGTDFTFEDIGDRKLSDYSYTLIKEESVGDKECWVIESIPNEKVVTDYAKILTWIWKDDFAPVKEEFYDKKGNLKKIKHVELQKTGKYWVASKMTMENIKSKHKTVILIENIEVDTGIDEKMFDTSYLKRIH